MRCLRRPLLFGLMLLHGCGSDGTMDPLARARELEASGDPEAAVWMLREAIRRTPRRPDLRRALGETLNRAGDGAAAEVALRQAIEFGEPRSELVVELAKALLLQGEYRRLLDEIDEQVAAGAADRLRIGLARLESAVRSGAADQRLLIREAAGLARRSSAAATPADVSDWLIRLRREHEVVEAGYAHFACAAAPRAAVVADLSPTTDRRVLRVGPRAEFRLPSAAAAVARDGDVVEIEAAVYTDVAVWPQSELLIRGRGGRPHIRAGRHSAEDKGLWVFSGRDVTIEDVELSGARASPGNGAAIRFAGHGLTVRRSFLHDNQNGLLAWNSDDGEILVEFTELAGNGNGDGLTHNLYVGQVPLLTVRFSYSHHVRRGHQIKSRARKTVIAYSRLADGEDGVSSYSIDLPEGGEALILGNELQQGPRAENRTMLAYAAERRAIDKGRLLIVNNTFYNQALDGIFVAHHGRFEALLANNIFAGAPAIVIAGPVRELANQRRPEHGLVDPRGGEFSLAAEAAAIDAGVDRGDTALHGAVAEFEYVHPTGGHSRPAIWRTDVGAHEFCGW